MRLYRSILIVLSFFVFTASKCKKDRGGNPIDQLPAATQKGANTFGCLVNGQAFTPGGSSLSGPNLSGIYQYIIPSSIAGYVFNVSGSDKRNNCNITSVGFEFDSVMMSQGIYPLKLRKNGQGGGGATFIICGSNPDIHQTDSNVVGELNLTRFDLSTQITSGTFWFNTINDKGDSVKITDGRFDVHFTR